MAETVSYVLYLLILIVFPVLIVATLVSIYKQLHSISWIKVPARVIDRITTCKHDPDQGDYFKLRIVAAYQVKGKDYLCGNLYPGVAGRDFKSQAKADAYLPQLIQGADIKLYMNPNNPDDSAIVRKLQISLFLIIAILSFFTYAAFNAILNL